MDQRRTSKTRLIGLADELMRKEGPDGTTMLFIDKGKSWRKKFVVGILVGVEGQG